MPESFEFEVNGTRHTVQAEPDATLLSVVRDQLGLTGAKYGCGEGQCGACTVLIDGNPRHSCVTKVGAVGARKITTIEGLERDGQLTPVQQAFLDEGAMQCAYCTSGMVMTATAMLRAIPHPTAEQVHEYMQGNVCRCGTYQRIVAAVLRAASAMNGNTTKEAS